MFDIKDSGKRREFGTGAHRDAAVGKGRCDLLPLQQASFILSAEAGDIVFRLGKFLDEQRIEELHAAIQLSIEVLPQFNKCPMTFLLEASHHYEEGAAKYGANNWKYGMPLSVFIDSGVRHFLKALRGDIDEPHHRAFAWNMLSALWMFENKPTVVSDLDEKDLEVRDSYIDVTDIKPASKLTDIGVSEATVEALKQLGVDDDDV